MSTQTAPLSVINTLALSKRLKRRGFTDEQAEGLAEELAETAQQARNELATKETVETVKKDIEIVIEKSKRETLQWVAGFLLAQTGLIITLLKLL